MRKRWAGPAAAVAVAALAVTITGCGTANPGEAAVVGAHRIPISTIGTEQASLNEILGQPPTTPNAAVTRSLVTTNVQVELIRQTAGHLGVSVPQAQVDAQYQAAVNAAGSEEALLKAYAAQYGVPPILVKDIVAATALVQAIVTKLDPTATQQRAQELLDEALRASADRGGVQVAPKYGVWDNQDLTVVDPDNPVSKPESVVTVADQPGR